MRRPIGLLTASLCAALTASSEASAAGFYNMPTNLQQCLGIGFGPGYHAPLVLGSPLKAKIASQPIRRHGPYPPAPTGGFAQPSAIIEQAPTHAAPHYAAPSYEVIHHGETHQPIFAAPAAASYPALAAPANQYQGYEEIPAPGLAPAP